MQAIACIRDLLSEEKQIWKANSVVNAYRDKFKGTISLSYARETLKSEFDMTFKKVKRVPYLGNSNRCMHLR